MEAPKGAETEASGPKGAGRGGRESHKTSANVRSAHEGRSEVREGEGGLGRRSVSSIEMLRRGWVSQTGEDETGDKQGTGPQNNGGLDDGDDRSRRQVEGGSKRGVEQGSREDVHERVVDRKVPALDGTAGTRSGEAGQTKESETAGGERLTDNGDDDTRHKRGNGIGWVDAAASGRIVLGDGALQEAAGDLGNAKSVAERQKKMSQFALHQEGGVLQEGHEGQETKEEEDWEHPDVDGVICKAMTAACSDGSGEGASEKHMEPMR